MRLAPESAATFAALSQQGGRQVEGDAGPGAIGVRIPTGDASTLRIADRKPAPAQKETPVISNVYPTLPPETSTSPLPVPASVVQPTVPQRRAPALASATPAAPVAPVAPAASPAAAGGSVFDVFDTIGDAVDGVYNHLGLICFAVCVVYCMYAYEEFEKSGGGDGVFGKAGDFLDWCLHNPLLGALVILAGAFVCSLARSIAGSSEMGQRFISSIPSLDDLRQAWWSYNDPVTSEVDKKITIEYDHEVEGIKNNKNLSDDQRSAALKNAEDTKDTKMKIKKEMSKISRRTDLLETRGLTGASKTKLAQLRTGVNNLREAAKDGVDQIDERRIDELSSDAKELEEMHV